ncbi:MAG: NAD(P)-dependent alcohol dehydrogenase [Parvibaculum sp.]
MKALSFKPPPPGSDKKVRPSLTHVDLSAPTPKKGEVRVRVTHAGLNNGDLEIWTGHANKSIEKRQQTNPVVSGIEMAGVALSDGKFIQKGDLVFGYTNIFKGPWFHAQEIVVAETKLKTIPTGWDGAGAASIIGGALTAIAALERIAKLKAGQSLLITGASGSVGLTALHLANHMGLVTTGICHSSQTEFVLAQGASAAFAYDRNEGPKKSSRFDAIFDTAPSLSFAKAKRHLKSRGTYITTMPHLDVRGWLRSLASPKKWGFLLEADTDEKRMNRLVTLMQAGAFKPIIDSSYPYNDAASAFRHQEEGRGKRGKVLITFG